MYLHLLVYGYILRFYDNGFHSRNGGFLKNGFAVSYARTAWTREPEYSGYDGLLYALVVFMVADYLTGVMCAINDQKLSSSVGFRGICRKVLILVLVGGANILDVRTSMPDILCSIRMERSGDSLCEDWRIYGERCIYNHGGVLWSWFPERLGKTERWKRMDCAGLCGEDLDRENGLSVSKDTDGPLFFVAIYLENV